MELKIEELSKKIDKLDDATLFTEEWVFISVTEILKICKVATAIKWLDLFKSCSNGKVYGLTLQQHPYEKSIKKELEELFGENDEQNIFDHLPKLIIYLHKLCKNRRYQKFEVFIKASTLRKANVWGWATLSRQGLWGLVPFRNPFRW